MRWFLGLLLIAAIGILWVKDPAEEGMAPRKETAGESGPETSSLSEAAPPGPPQPGPSRQLLSGEWRAAHQLSFHHAASTDGSTSLTILFRCPNGWIGPSARVSIGSDGGHAHGFAVESPIPGEAVFADHRPGMEFWSGSCSPPCGSLLEGNEEAAFALSLDSILVPGLAPVRLQPGHDHQWEVHLENWASAVLVLCEASAPLPAWAGSLWFRPDAPRTEWIELDPPARDHVSLLSLRRPRQVSVPLVPPGRYEFLVEGPWKGARIRWKEELSSWLQEVPVPLPPTRLSILPPSGEAPREHPLRSKDLSLWVLSWNDVGLARTNQPSLRFRARLPKLLGYHHRFLPVGKYQFLAWHEPSSMWGKLSVELEEDRHQQVEPVWTSGGTAKVAVEGWKWAAGAAGRLVLVHLDSGWQSEVQWMRQDPAQKTFHHLPPGRFQAIWGEPDRGPQRGFSQVFEVRPRQSVEVYFQTTTDGGGSFAGIR